MISKVEVKNIVEYAEKPETIGECGVAVPVAITKVIEAFGGSVSVAIRYLNVNDRIENNKVKEHMVPIESVVFPSEVKKSIIS